MFSKKSLPVVALLLMLAAALIAGASQVIQQQVPAGPVVQSPGATTKGDTGLPTVPSAPALPAASGTVTLSDGFDKLSANTWRTLADFQGKWVATEGRLEQWGNVDGETTDDTTILVSSDTSFADGVFEAQVFPTSGEPVGVVFRGSDAGYYRLTLYPDLGVTGSAPKARLDKVTAGKGETVAESKGWAGFKKSEWQRIEVKATGSQLAVSVGATQLFSVSNSGPTKGWVGVWTIADRGARFDNVRVQRDVAGRK